MIKKYIKPRLLARLLLLLPILGMVGCSESYDEHFERKGNNAVGFSLTLQENGCSEFASKLADYGYDALLSESRLFTIFAPKDAAFSELINGKSEEQIKVILLYHIFNGKISSSSITEGVELYSISGKKIISQNNSLHGYNGDFGGIEKGNLDISNGTLHILEKAFEPALSLGEYLAANYSKFGELFQFFSEENPDIKLGYSVVNENGNSDVVFKGMVKYEYLNPYNEIESYTLLPFHDTIYNKSFGRLEQILTGNEIIEEEKVDLFSQFMESHIYPELYDSLSLADSFVKNSSGIPSMLPEHSITKGNVYLSNGIVHEIDTVLMSMENIQARIDFYYKTVQLPLGTTDDNSLANSSRSNNTKLSKENDLAIWTKDQESTKEGGYLFFTMPRELAAAKYKVSIEHEIDSAYTDLVQVKINDTVLTSALEYRDSTSVVGGSTVSLIQDLGEIEFSEYQKETVIRFDIVEERFGDLELQNDTILKIKNLSFVPVMEEEDE